MTSYMLTLPFMTPSQNTWQRSHWGKQKKLKTAIELLIRVGLNELGLYGAARPNCRVRVIIRRYSSHHTSLDRGNFIGGCKPLLDALRDEGVIFDDSERWLEDRYEQHACKRGAARTEIEVAHLAKESAA